MTRSDRTGTRSLAAFLKFAGLSGAGWLLDALLLLALVSAAGWQPFHANIASSCTAALAVFMVSRQMVFQKASRALLLRVGAYLAYSLCLILAASAMIDCSAGMVDSPPSRPKRLVPTNLRAQ